MIRLPLAALGEDVAWGGDLPRASYGASRLDGPKQWREEGLWKPLSKENHLAAYIVGIVRNVQIGPPIIEYIERIDATLPPFRGRFAAQDLHAELLEGDASGFVVIVEFPDLGEARRWYDSDGYRAIRPLRAENSATTLFIARGVGPDHRATDILGRPPDG